MQFIFGGMTKKKGRTLLRPPLMLHLMSFACFQRLFRVHVRVAEVGRRHEVFFDRAWGDPAFEIGH